MLVTFLVGASRVYLGVHYPTDVLAGWIMGLTWALACWVVERRSNSAPVSDSRSRRIRPGDAAETPSVGGGALADGRTPRMTESVTPAPGARAILLVEDEPAVRQLFASALQRAGYLVHQARSGEEAVSVFEAYPAIDLLLTDIRMPEMSGLELVRQLSARAPALKVILHLRVSGRRTESGDHPSLPRQAVLTCRPPGQSPRGPRRLTRFAVRTRPRYNARRTSRASTAGRIRCRSGLNQTPYLLPTRRGSGWRRCEHHSTCARLPGPPVLRVVAVHTEPFEGAYADDIHRHHPEPHCFGHRSQHRVLPRPARILSRHDGPRQRALRVRMAAA